MKNKKRMIGKKKMTSRNGGINSSKKVNNPILQTDIKSNFERFSSDLSKKHRYDGMFYHMVFFIGLSVKFSNKGWNNSPNQKLFKSLIDRFNSYMSQHELMGEVVEHMDTPLPLIYEDLSFENVLGKYQMSIKDGVPILHFPDPDTFSDCAEQIVASALLDYIYELTDIRIIEASIPKLTGLCDYLKTLAPDAYHAYCKLGEQVNYDTPIDFKGNRVFWGMIINGKLLKRN